MLVPGAWHSGWCWHRTAAQLASAGHHVLAMDLAGADASGAGTAAVTLDQWVDSICELLQRGAEPTVLVAHSRGGIVISQVAERMPDRVAGLVYISGFLLCDGDSVLRMLREDGGSPFLSRVTLSRDRSQWILDRASAREMFYGECSEEDARLAISKLGVEPAAPMMTPIHVTEARFGRVPRAYIECLRDGAVPLTLQRRMQARLPCARITSIDTDHAPFLSAPDQLARALLEP